MEFLILMGLIILNGLFAMSEIALVTARKARLMKLSADGDASAAIALKLGEEPTRFLSTVQIGITSIGVLNGIVGEAALAGPLATWLIELGIPDSYANGSATALVVVVITYVTIVVGELVPKRVGQLNPELIARLVARPMQTLALITRPFVRLLTFSTEALLRIMGVRNDNSPGVTEEEIHALLLEGSESGVIEQQQHEMVRNVFRLDDRKLGSLMIPRTDIVYIDLNLPIKTNLEHIANSVHSRFPVCEGNFSNLIGVIHAKHILASHLRGEEIDIKKHMQPCFFVPETLTGMEMLEQFRSNSVEMAFAIDEYGEVEGLVTLQDLLEALTGEFQSNNDDDAWFVQREDGSWLLDGIIPVPELKDCLTLKSVPEEEKNHYNTLSGLIMWLLGRIPKTGDYVDWEGWRFEVVDMDEKRIDKVLATPIIETGDSS